MTYRELLNNLKKLSPKQLDQPVHTWGVDFEQPIKIDMLAASREDYYTHPDAPGYLIEEDDYLDWENYLDRDKYETIVTKGEVLLLH